MNKILFSIIFIVISAVGISQNSLEDRLLEVFSEKQTKLILEDNQQKEYYNKMVFYSFSLEKINSNKVKYQKLEILNSLELKNIDGTIITITPKELIESINNGTFNILKLRLDRDLNSSKVYLLGNTNQTLKLNSFRSLSNSEKK